MNFVALTPFACATCSNAWKHGGADAIGWAIAVMLMCIVPIASGVLFLMVRIARRERAGLDPQYMDDYIPGSPVN